MEAASEEEEKEEEKEEEEEEDEEEEYPDEGMYWRRFGALGTWHQKYQPEPLL